MSLPEPLWPMLAAVIVVMSFGLALLIARAIPPSSRNLKLRDLRNHVDGSDTIA